jgi:hypothetical protein
LTSVDAFPKKKEGRRLLASREEEEGWDYNSRHHTSNKGYHVVCYIMPWFSYIIPTVPTTLIKDTYYLNLLLHPTAHNSNTFSAK